MAKKGLGRGLGALLSDNLPDLPDESHAGAITAKKK